MFAFAPALPSRSDVDWCWYLRKQGAMGDAVERILHDIGVMDPSGWADWHPSTLTNTGAPVTVNFTQDEQVLELTMDVANPATNPDRRVSEVCNIIKRLGGTGPTAALRDVISAAQGDAQLRYGARLGIRQSASQLQTMLYAELPAGAGDLSSLMSSTNVSPVLKELGDQAYTTMLGCDGTTGQVTQYWMVEGVDRTVLPKLAAPANVDAGRLSAAIDKLTDTTLGLALPTCKMGFSYATTENGSPPELALYFSAQRLFGCDATAEQYVRSSGMDRMAGYANLMEILSPAPIGQTHHGMIEMTAHEQADPTLTVSVAAAWHCPFETM